LPLIVVRLSARRRLCRSISPASTALSSKPAARRGCGGKMKQAGRRKLDRCMDHAPHHALDEQFQ